MAEKNFDKVHVNGVYESVNKEKYVVVPEERRKSWTVGDGEFTVVVFEIETAQNQTPGWNTVDDIGESGPRKYTGNEYDLVKYIGEYNWETGEIEMKKPESYLVSKNIIEVNAVYQHEKFAAIVTIRNGKKLVNFDFKGCIEKANDLEVEDFKQLLKLLNAIPLEDL